MPTTEAADKKRISRLMLFFALGYFAEGTGQTAGLINQPLTYYLKQVGHWTPSQVSAAMTVTWLPWVIKPVYGILSDFLPIAGYRRKTYLILSNALAAIAYFAIAWVASAGSAIFLVMLTAYGMAAASTLYGALLVENGQHFGKSSSFVNQQWLWFNIAQVGVSLLGGALVEYLAPTQALHTAGMLVAITPIAVIFATVFLVDEKRAPVSMDGLKSAFRALLKTFTRRELYVVALFLFVYRLNPGIGSTTAFYYYLTDHMKFSQGFIGITNSLVAGGWIVGALAYRRFFTGATTRSFLNLSIAAGVVSNLTYLLLVGQISAGWISFLSGTAFAINYVASIGLAADFCPPGAEGFAFAILMSVDNLAMSASDNAGSYLYEHVFHSSIQPLILVSAALTACAFFLVPFLGLGNKKQGESLTTLRESVENPPLRS